MHVGATGPPWRTPTGKGGDRGGGGMCSEMIVTTFQIASISSSEDVPILSLRYLFVRHRFLQQDYVRDQWDAGHSRSQRGLM